MPNFLKEQPKWMSVVFAVLVLSCGLLGADILGQLTEYFTRSSEPVGDLASHADSAPPGGAYRAEPFRLSGKTKDVQPSPSASPAQKKAEGTAVEIREDTTAQPGLPAAGPASQQTAGAAAHPGEPYSTPDYPSVRRETSNNSYIEAEENEEIALQGIMLGSSAGIAVVEYEGSTYTVGQGEKLGDYTVEDIQADRVTFKRRGKLSQVHIDTPADSPGSSAPAGTDGASALGIGDYPPVLPPPEAVPLPPQPVSLPEAKRRPSGTSAGSDAVYSITEADFSGGADMSPAANELTREELDDFTRKGAALLADIRGTEVENGRGIQVQFRNPDNALAKLGMKDGDVVLRINSKTVVGVEDIYNAVLTMRDAPQIDIEITRDGQPLSLFHKFPEH